jgi:hypothetical protein
MDLTQLMRFTVMIVQVCNRYDGDELPTSMVRFGGRGRELRLPFS